jgi:hypothetical protein
MAAAATAAPAAVQQQQQQPLTIPIITSKEEMRAFSRKQKLAGKTIGFVPTMVGWAAGFGRSPQGTTTAPVVAAAAILTLSCAGVCLWMQGYLHQGHLSLVEEAK